MDVRELSAREPFAQLLTTTLSTGLEARYGQRFDVEVGRGGDQEWHYAPPLNGFYVARPAADVRRFLRDGFRFTPVVFRAVPQFIIGTLLATGGGLRVAGRCYFSVTPAVPQAEQLLILPGNRRIRIFDFDRWVTRVVAKDGFGVESVRNEVLTRRGGAGPYLSVSDCANDFSWFEESIVGGYPLPRCPPWLSRVSAERDALAALRDYTRSRSTRQPAADYVNPLLVALDGGFQRLPAMPDASAMRDLVQNLGRAVLSATRVLEVGPTHGDLQPGNIMIMPDGRSLIIDWEHAGVRSIGYDSLVYGLGTRRPDRFERLRRHFREVPSEARAASMAFLLEELRFYLDECTSGPFAEVPGSSLGFFQDALRLAKQMFSI